MAANTNGGDLEGWTIAFDLDGTLVETAPDLIGTLNRMLAARDIPAMPVEAAQHLVGHGALALLRHGFQEAGAAWDEALAPALLSLGVAEVNARRAVDHAVIKLGEDADLSAVIRAALQELGR